MLAQVNAARAKPRLCGRKRFAAARPLAWNTALGTAAQRHSRAMANDNFFAHRDLDGDLPADRAWDAGYRGRADRREHCRRPRVTEQGDGRLAGQPRALRQPDEPDGLPRWVRPLPRTRVAITACTGRCCSARP
ncbi:hypothetical protein PPS11_37715 [Pseudomonas putida S11]|nr:hypothetical protein PPS11_37715 [Pseudomonas putida S11]